MRARSQHRWSMDRTENVWANNFALATHASETCSRPLKNAASYDRREKKGRKKKAFCPRGCRGAFVTRTAPSWGIGRREFAVLRPATISVLFLPPPFSRFKPLSLVKGRRTGRYATARMMRNGTRTRELFAKDTYRCGFITCYEIIRQKYLLLSVRCVRTPAVGSSEMIADPPRENRAREILIRKDRGRQPNICASTEITRFGSIANIGPVSVPNASCMYS